MQDMALLKRFDTLEVATADLDDAIKTYRANFGFELKSGPAGDRATLKVGGTEIALASGAAAAAAISVNGEGLAGLWLEAEDIERVSTALKSAGIEPPPVQIDRGRRVLALDPAAANQVPLFIFDRKT
jgi:predicted enzyme related to lactoylglutathione lyase